jgi:hypothetical protein
MMNSRLTELHAAIQRGIRDSKPLAGIVRVSPQCGISIRPMSVQGHTRPFSDVGSMSGLLESGHWNDV